MHDLLKHQVEKIKPQDGSDVSLSSLSHSQSILKYDDNYITSNDIITHLLKCENFAIKLNRTISLLTELSHNSESPIIKYVYFVKGDPDSYTKPKEKTASHGKSSKILPSLLSLINGSKND